MQMPGEEFPNLDFLDTPRRQGSSGRIPDSQRSRHKLFQKVNVSIEPEIFDRLEKYCADEERARSWVIQKALDAWLEQKGY